MNECKVEKKFKRTYCSHSFSHALTLLSPTYSFFSHALTLFSHALTHRRSLFSHALTHSDLSPSHRFNFFFTVSKKIKLGENSQNLGLRKSKGLWMVIICF
ncbi:hypothetical protein P8452_21946 [Trifolium repens]|nr:hypothetical protein P8452_21946 [Trifolium repens]